MYARTVSYSNLNTLRAKRNTLLGRIALFLYRACHSLPDMSQLAVPRELVNTHSVHNLPNLSSSHECLPFLCERLVLIA